jgi:hypothetical protein
MTPAPSRPELSSKQATFDAQQDLQAPILTSLEFDCDGYFVFAPADLGYPSHKFYALLVSGLQREALRFDQKPIGRTQDLAADQRLAGIGHGHFAPRSTQILP